MRDDDVSLFRDLAAAPRPTGGAAIAKARERCARELRALGYDVAERPFEFSEFPGRFATPLGGAVAAVVVGVAGGAAVNEMRFVPLTVLVVGALALLVAGGWLARRGVLVAPVLRARGINLEATRPGSDPRVWLCAHLDSKSQPIPTLVRTVGVVLESLGFLLALVLALLVALDLRVHEFFWSVAAVVTLLGALPVVSSMVGSRSPGALDNASGVVTVLSAARLLKDESRVGVLLTDAEELGLAGARAWSSQAQASSVLNCDSVDDAGVIQVTFTGRRPGRLLHAVEQASSETGVRCSIGRLIPGILTDAVAFTDRGYDSVTFSRLSLRSLARIHSRRDDLAHLGGDGIRDVARLITATAASMRRGHSELS